MANTVSKQRTVTDAQLTEGRIIMVRGNIEYSRLVRKIEGEELEQDKKRKIALGMNPVDKPYTTVQLTNARIIPLVAGQQTLEETFVEERFYRRANDPADAPYHFSINNKSPFGNQFYQARPGKPAEGDQIQPENELANGLDVILVLRVFKPKNFNRKGITLHSIILQEPVRYYVGANNKALEEAGIILHSSPAAPAAPGAPSTVSAPAPGEAFSTPAPQAAQPAPAPAQAPAPQPAPAPAAAMPDPEGPWTCPQCGNLVAAGQAFCGSCGTKKDAAAQQPMGGGNPYAAQAAAAQTQSRGIRYDGGDTGRNY